MGTGKRIGRPKGSKSGYTVSEKALAQRRKAQPNKSFSIPAEGEEKEYNAKVIEHILRIHEISTHADIKDPVSLKSCFINYLLLCQQDGCRVGNLSACAAMGITPNTLRLWARSERTEYRELAQFVQLTCSVNRETLISDQKINPVIGIFWQRNYDGLRNDTEQQQVIQEQEKSEELTPGDYKKKYGKLLDE